MAKRSHNITHTAALGGLQEAFDATLVQALALSGITQEDQVAEVIATATADAIPQVTAAILKGLKRAAPKMLRERRDEDAGFERRNYRRWRRAFDFLEMIWVLAEEAGAHFNERYRADAAKDNDYCIEALTSLHARSLLVVREIMCLLHGGFPDGAMGRWRTLHELTVIGSFVQKYGQEIAHRYLASRFFASYRAATELEKHAERANLEPFSAEEIEQMKTLCDHFVGQFGKEMRNDYGWASPALNNNPKPTFRMIEEAVKLDHWRPRYKWASQHIHGPHRPTHALLGMAEAQRQVLLVGQSNSGMTDPIHMTAISLAIATSNLVVMRPSLDSVVVMNILSKWSKDIGPLAVKVEQESLNRSMKRRTKRRSKGGSTRRRAKIT